MQQSTSNALSRFVIRSHTVAIRDCWIQRYKPERLFFRKINIAKFVVDETQIKVGSSEYIFGCGGLQLNMKKRILLQQENIKRAKYVICSTERDFYTRLLKNMGRISNINRDRGNWYPSQACKFLQLRHHIHSSYLRKASLLNEQSNT